MMLQMIFDIHEKGLYVDWGIDIVPHKLPKLKIVMKTVKDFLGILVRECTARDSILVSDHFPGDMIHWLRVTLLIDMCGIGISGKRLGPNTRRWMNVDKVHYNYVPNCFLMLSLQNAIDTSKVYINDYFKVTDDGLLYCCKKYADYFDCEHLVKMMQNGTVMGNDKLSARINTKMKKRMLKKFKEHAVARMKEFTLA